MVPAEGPVQSAAALHDVCQSTVLKMACHVAPTSLLERIRLRLRTVRKALGSCGRACAPRVSRDVVRASHGVMQGDVLLAERLNQKLTKADGRCSLVATFIHRVVPTLETISSLRSRKSNKAAWLAAWRDANVFFNRTPIGMAAQVRCTRERTSAQVSQPLSRAWPGSSHERAAVPRHAVMQAAS